MVASTGPLEYPKAIGVTVKTCTKCKIEQALSEFGNRKRSSDGKAPHCNTCRTAYRKSHHRANRERNNAKSRAYRAANLERLRAYDAARHAANPQPMRDRARKWAQANKGRVAINVSRWRAENAEHVREMYRLRASLRRARRASLPTFTILPKDVRRILTSPCAVDGCLNTDIQIDHIIPIARGGSHGIGNLQPLCASHNAAKCARLWIEFRSYLALRNRTAA